VGAGKKQKRETQTIRARRAERASSGAEKGNAGLDQKGQPEYLRKGWQRVWRKGLTVSPQEWESYEERLKRETESHQRRAITDEGADLFSMLIEHSFPSNG